MLSCVRIYYSMNEHIADKMKNANLFFAHADKKITKTEIAKHPENFIIKYNWALSDWLNNNSLSDYNFIYSMWHGYLTRQKTWNQHIEHLTEIHTSGHADISDLQEFVKRINPKTIIPIHTECKNDFRGAFGVNTMILNDNETVEL